MTQFAAQALAERARLALVDPEGELEAVAPLGGVRARQILLDWADRELEARRRPVTAWRRGDRRPDGHELVVRLGGDPSRDRGRVPCPAHGGRDANLAWRIADDGRALLKCHSHQCTFAEILEAIR